MADPSTSNADDGSNDKHSMSPPRDDPGEVFGEALLAIMELLRLEPTPQYKRLKKLHEEWKRRDWG